MLEINEEKYINDSPTPVSITGMEEILGQMKKCVCKIKIGNKDGTGFFAKIPYQLKYKNVLITNNHILKKDDLKIGNIIKISINNEKEYKKINIDEKRLILTDDKKDVTIIEIKEKDNINNFIEVDERYNQENIDDRYRNESLYVLNYPKGENIVVSFGLLKNIENYNISHLCSTEPGSSGSPIISLKSFKLIGLHKGGHKKYNYNIGLFIKYVVDEFIKKMGNNNNIPIKEKNKINAKIEEIKKKFENTENKIKGKKSEKDEIKKKNKIENQLEKPKIINKIENKIKDNKLNEITIKYKIDKDDNKIRIFGKDFIKNNKNKCKIIIEGKEEEIKEYINIDKTLKNKNILEIKLKEITTVTDMSYMFFHCSNLLSLLISKWDIKNVTNMSHMFSYCYNLTSLPDIYKWDTKNVIDMSYLFYYCNNLSSLPDISKWNIKNVKNKSYMFEGCNKLSPLPIF